MLCTANQCRSPMAEALLRHRLEAAGIPARVSSAGLYPGGSPATADGVAVMGRRGIDTSEHVSRRLAREMVEEASLVIGMAREHVREAAVLSPVALGRSFTLKELVGLGERLGARQPDEDLPAWLARMAAARDQRRLVGMGHDPSYDVEDPVGQGRAAYEATVAELDDLIDRLVAVAFTPTSEERNP